MSDFIQLIKFYVTWGFPIHKNLVVKKLCAFVQVTRVNRLLVHLSNSNPSLVLSRQSEINHHFILPVYLFENTISKKQKKILFEL